LNESVDGYFTLKTVYIEMSEAEKGRNLYALKESNQFFLSVYSEVLLVTFVRSVTASVLSNIK
jgi:hypothetical protein